MNNGVEGYSRNFVDKFSLAIIRVIEREEFKIENPVFIDSDLIPRLSYGLMQSLIEKRTAIDAINNVPAPSLSSRQQPHLIQYQHMQVEEQGPKLIVPPMGPPMKRAFVPDEYGLITALLSDPTVTKIIMPSPGQPVSVIRMGQREQTKIVLSIEQVQQIFERISENAHIPLLEGTFRAAIDNFSINAIYSSLVGSKFVIEKQTPYSGISS